MLEIDYALPNNWFVSQQCDKQRRYTYDPGGGTVGHVILNQSNANLQWCVADDRDSYYEGHAGYIAGGGFHINARGRKNKEMRLLTCKAAMELVETAVHNCEMFEVPE